MTILVVASVIVGFVVTLNQPWLEQWGATAAERAETFPGDDIVADASAVYTQSVSIDAPPGEVWRWLVQMGQDKAGFYSFDWAETFTDPMRSATMIHPEWQQLEVGDLIHPFPPERGLPSWARLVAAGTLAFVVYDYAYYVFGTGFNDVFLLHVAAFSTALIALILTLSSMDVAGIAARFRMRTPVRAVAFILGVLAASLAGLWISGSLRFALNGTVPDVGNALLYPIEITHLGYAMDLAFLVPAYALAAVLLWRRRPWGHVLGAVMLVAGALTQLTYIAALVFQSRAVIAGASGFDTFAPVILGVYLAGAGLLLGNLRRDRNPTAGVAPLT